MQESFLSRINRIQFQAEIYQNSLKIFLRRTAVKMAIILGLFIVSKIFYMDWVVKIPITNGGVVRHYPKNSPIWRLPTPRPPFTDFETEAVVGYASGDGPSILPNTARIYPNLMLITAEVIILAFVLTVCFSICGLWRAAIRETQPRR